MRSTANLISSRNSLQYGFQIYLNHNSQINFARDEFNGLKNLKTESLRQPHCKFNFIRSHINVAGLFCSGLTSSSYHYTSFYTLGV